jgi:hypothetical protein
MFPLDDDVTFTPRVQLFSRPRYGVLPAVETEWPIPSAVAVETGVKS